MNYKEPKALTVASLLDPKNETFDWQDAHAASPLLKELYHENESLKSSLDIAQKQIEELKRNIQDAVYVMKWARFGMEMNHWNWKSDASNDLRRGVHSEINDAIKKYDSGDNGMPHYK